MKVTLFESISVNGIIARPNGRGDFLTDDNWTEFVDFARRAGAMVWGRTTHDLVRGWGPNTLPQLRGIQGIVLTSDQDYAVEPGWVTAGTPREAVTAAERAGSEGLLVAGGRTVNTAFLAERLVDEVVIDVESVIVARGVPLVAEADLEVALKLTGVRQLTETVVQLRYDVVR